MGLEEVNLTDEIKPNAAPEGASAERSESPLPGVAKRNWDKPISDTPGNVPLVAPEAPVSGSPDPGATAAASAASAVGTGSDSAPAPAAPEPFEFAGKKWEKGRAQAEHSFKTLQGMFSSNEKAAQAARLRVLELERDLARLQNGKSTEVPPVARPNGQAAAAPTDEPTAADTYAVFEVLKEKFGTKIAQEWYDEKLEERANTKFQKMLDEKMAKLEERLQPFEQTNEQRGVALSMAKVFQEMSTFTFPDGSPAYPELKDERVMRDVGVLWKNLKMDPSVLQTNQGVHLAIVTYRDAMAARARLAPKTTAPAPVSRPAVDPGVVSAGGDSSHSLTPAPAVNPNDIGERLLRAKVGPDPKLGFTVRSF